MSYYRKIDPLPWAMRVALVLFVASILAILLSCMQGCAPKDSSKQFHRPKYKVATEKPVDGRPAVVQRWWSKGWIWQPRHGRRRNTGQLPDSLAGAAAPTPKYTPSR